MSINIVGNDKLQEKMVYIKSENMKSNSVSDWFREKGHVISCALTCALSNKASVHKQIFSHDKERIARLKR